MPSLLSLQVISAFEGPSTASDRPPGRKGKSFYFQLFDTEICLTENINRVRSVVLTFSCILGDHSESGSFVNCPVTQTWTVSSHHSAVHSIHIELQRASCRTL